MADTPSNSFSYDAIVIGAGAAGVFAGISAKVKNPSLKVVILEKSLVSLAKVRISGGGRCNVTHACFDPGVLIQNYPRGGKELRGPFSRFQPKDTIEWFESRGVLLKVEKDGRVFPQTDSSSSIIDCLLYEAQKLGVPILFQQKIEEIKKVETGFEVGPFSSKKLILATGSSKQGYAWAAKLGHTITQPVPSLFTFNVPSSPLKDLSGIAVDPVEVQIPRFKLKQKGALLITHFGFSGPAVLKLSAWGARFCYEKSYQFDFKINWLPHLSSLEIEQKILDLKKTHPSKSIKGECPFSLPKNLWKELCLTEKKYRDISRSDIEELKQKLQGDLYQADGKTLNKEEFVTCGGVFLKEVNFKTMESKVCQGLYFAGEILDIDGVTGGFNFQNAWTTGYLAGST